MESEVDPRDVLYWDRWTKATPSEQRFLIGLVELGHGEPVLPADLASYLGKATTESISSTRRDLVRKGWIHRPRGPYRGRVALKDPKASAFLGRRGQ